MSKFSTKPYLLRAIYEWCIDSSFTPHIAVWVNEHTQVPMQYVRDNQIILNISPSACQNLVIDNEWINFTARFSGVAHEIWIPVGQVGGIFARENHKGMGFEIEPPETKTELSMTHDEANPKNTKSPKSPKPQTEPPKTPPETNNTAKPKSKLKIVK
ncbi:ClpXP protease specificity-enhancing factor [Stenoxybacter acetivorans]|uniref:ClpXP protease specificity-enhancing factor n=1 Tax=Stenoxybacter acetivorans TaxID=422441 RepID=UPI00056276D0|nr:ClpXP protease specificity-enhancing factor [Stenoxybacter acetivorans]